MRFLGSHQWKSFTEIKPHLVAKNASCAGTRTIAFIGTLFNDMFNKVKVLLHGCKVNEKLKVILIIPGESYADRKNSPNRKLYRCPSSVVSRLNCIFAPKNF